MFNSSTKEQLDRLVKSLFPIKRTLLGREVRNSLSLINEFLESKLNFVSIKSGEVINGWSVPNDWRLNSASIKDIDGNILFSHLDHQLRVMVYSSSFSGKVDKTELMKHIFTNPDLPEAIPYRTSYYNNNWGFCLSHSELEKLKGDEFIISIDTEFKADQLDYAELIIPGKSNKQILITSYICHPSLFNDNISGVVNLILLAKSLLNFEGKPNYTYRFLIAPETIGIIAWLKNNKDSYNLINEVIVSTCVGYGENFTLKKSFSKNTSFERLAEYYFNKKEQNLEIMNFSPTGSDERQFSSPGVRLPTSLLMKAPFIGFKQYHTSDDNLSLYDPAVLFESYTKYSDILELVDNNICFSRVDNGIGEVHLSQSGLYPSIGGGLNKDYTNMIKWVMYFADSANQLYKISQVSGYDYEMLTEVVSKMLKQGIIKECF
jgi:aminopeptidase-like protein